MGTSTKKQNYQSGNTAGKRAGMNKGNAPNPGQGKTHDAGFTYAPFVKSNPKVGGQGK